MQLCEISCVFPGCKHSRNCQLHVAKPPDDTAVILANGDVWGSNISCLVVWNIFCSISYIGNNNPNWFNWLIFFRGVETTNQFTSMHDPFMVGQKRGGWYPFSGPPNKRSLYIAPMFAIPSPVGEKTYRTLHCIYHHISYMSYLKSQFGWSHHMCCLNPQLEPILVGGLEHYVFFHILGIIIPTDFHIFLRDWNHQLIELDYGKIWENLQESPIFDGKNHGFL